MSLMESDTLFIVMTKQNIFPDGLNSNNHVRRSEVSAVRFNGPWGCSLVFGFIFLP